MPSPHSHIVSVWTMPLACECKWCVNGDKWTRTTFTGHISLLSEVEQQRIFAIKEEIVKSIDYVELEFVSNPFGELSDSNIEKVL